MGLFSSIFSGVIKGIASNTSFVGAYREASGKSYGGGGWGLDRFQSVIDAHSSTDDMVEMFALDSESCPYMSVDGYANPYMQAYTEHYREAQIEAEMINAMMGMFGETVDPEDLIDWDAVEEDAYQYACDLFDAWYDGSYWIPEEVMDYAWYALSDHNY